MGIWDDLTARHKRYACLALLLGLLFGAVTGAVAIAIAVVVGGSLTASGVIFYIRNKTVKTSEKAYIVGMAISIACIVGGLMCFVGACAVLYLHQMGAI